MTYDEIESYLSTHFWPVLTAKVPVLQPVSDRLFARLSDADITAIEAAAPDSVKGNLQKPVLRKLALINVATHMVPGAAKALCIPSAVPPPSVHRMQRTNPLWCGDLYSANMLGQALEAAGLGIEPGRRYLDFGCSSGSMTRVMRAAYPDSLWHGVDPVPNSIGWASQNLPGISFQTSQQTPPLDFPRAYFDGVYAISIWSHFSERAAIQWFAEMARIVRTGGWLMLTSCGLVSLMMHVKRRTRTADRIGSLISQLVDRRYAFEPMRGTTGLDMTDWGLSYFDADWVANHLTAEWSLRLFQPGRNQANQDVYVLVRR